MVDYLYDWDLSNGTSTTAYTVSWPEKWTQATPTNSLTTSNIWFGWNNGTIQLQPYQPYQPLVFQQIFEPAPAPTPEQIETRRVAAEQRAAEWRERTEREAAEREAAKNRAKILLEENLSAEQRAQLHDNSWFEVITPKGRYRIRHGRSGNVDKLVDGRVVEKFCIHPTEDVPNEDTMLAQKLLLEADEEAFRRIANITRM